MFCLKCGSVIPEGSLYCTKCGLKAGEAPEASASAPVPQPQPQYAPPQPPSASQPMPVQPQPQYVPPQPPPVPQPRPQYVPPTQQYVPPQPQPAPPQYAQPQPQPRYAQPQYAPRIVDQGPKARGRILLLVASIVLALISLISMILQIFYFFGGAWITFPSSNFLSGLQFLQASFGLDFTYAWTIPFYTASIIVLGISIAGMPAAFSKKSGNFFIVTGIIFGLGQFIGFISPLITNTIYYGIPFQDALYGIFTPVNIILSIIEIGLPVLYIAGGILNKKTSK